MSSALCSVLRWLPLLLCLAAVCVLAEMERMETHLLSGSFFCCFLFSFFAAAVVGHILPACLSLTAHGINAQVRLRERETGERDRREIKEVIEEIEERSERKRENESGRK